MEFARRFENWKHWLLPAEDSVKLEEGILVVGDGVTRDPMERLPDLKTLRGRFEFVWNYPRPSPAAQAAEIFTSTMIEVLRDYERQKRDRDAIWEGFRVANERIWKELNEGRECDYLTNDLAGCVGAAAIVDEKGEGLAYGWICDCGIGVWDEFGNLRWKSENDGPDRVDEGIWKDERLKGKNWRNPEARVIVRRDYRNKPLKEYSYGVLTGEKVALNFVTVGEREIQRGNYVGVYSDGVEKIILGERFREGIWRKDLGAIEGALRQVRTEGSLALKKVNGSFF